MGYSRTGVPFGLDPTDRAFVGAPIMSGVPVLDQDINLMHRIEFSRFTEFLTRIFSDGWVTGGVLGGNSSNNNTITIGDSLLFLEGYYVTLAGVNTSANLITLASPPDSGTRYDLVFVEFWMERVSSSGTIYKYGNTQYYSTNPTNDIVDSAIGLPATERLQLRYRVRSLSDALNLDDTDCHVQGKKVAPDSSYHWTYNSTKLVWYCNAGSAFDDLTGYVYALPICKVLRPQLDGNIPLGNIVDMRWNYTTNLMNFFEVFDLRELDRFSIDQLGVVEKELENIRKRVLMTGQVTITNANTNAQWLMATALTANVTLPYTLPNANYTVLVEIEDADNKDQVGDIKISSKATNGFTITVTGNTNNIDLRWTVVDPKFWTL